MTRTEASCVVVSLSFFLQSVAVAAVVMGLATWMALVAVKMVRLPKRNGWQLAWLIISGVLTVFPGSISIASVFILVYSSLTGIENESVGYAMLGAYLASALWLIPIIGTYLIGVAVVRIATGAREE